MPITPNDEESLLPTIHSKLQALAGPEHLWPEWYCRWLTLGADSSDAQRVAVCREIRESGDLPDNAGFSLVVWQINEIADRLAETRLGDLTDRMDALDSEYESMHGHSWPDGEEPAEYTELFLEYDRACSEIFVECLHAFGERDMAEDYANDLAAFNRRYERGLDYFESAGDPALQMTDDLVKVASFATLSDADFARFALEAEGISMSFDNANLVACDWLLANAVQGIKLFVRKKDAARTLQVLQSLHRPNRSEHAKFNCPSCGEPAPAAWDVCWKCGHDRAATETMPQDSQRKPEISIADSAPPPAAADSLTEDADSATSQFIDRLITIAVGVLVLLALLTLWKRPVLGAVILSFFVLLIFTHQMVLRSGADPHEDTHM